MKRLFHYAPLMAGTALLLVSACNRPLDMDMRGVFDGPSTSEAALNATAKRPEPDSRGIISYPGYQVVVARRGDTVNSVAARIGVDAAGLARYNGMQRGDLLRDGEILALNTRVAEPEGGPVDITSIAGNALNGSGGSSITTSELEPATTNAANTAQQQGAQPARHRVERGETAYSIARLYNVSVRSLAEWNGLGSDMSVREGQQLIIPVAVAGAGQSGTTSPGEGSPTPLPPSASQPLPDEKTRPASEPVQSTAAPDLGKNQSAGNARMSRPVAGDIVRTYEKGKNEGIDIAASPGASVAAASGGTVAAITKDTNGRPIVVVKHEGQLLTVYSNLGNVSVKKGDAVKRGQTIGTMSGSGNSALHFEVRNGFDSVDPEEYLG